MPPKPWLTKNGPPKQDISVIVQSQPTIKQQIPKITIQQPLPSVNTTGINQGQNSNFAAMNGTTTSQNIATGLAGTTSNSMLGNTGGYGSYGGYGSSYGSSYGGYGSGYGSYGGYGGGYGSSYGMGGYGGYGMGGYGRYGMMGNADPNNPQGFIMNTLMTLQSFGFLIQSFCQIGRSLDHNIEGLNHFFSAFTNLFKKIYNGIKNGCNWLSQKTKNSLLCVLDFIKTYILFMKNQQKGERMRSLKMVMNVCIVVFVFSLYPLIKKGLHKVT